MQKQRMKRLSEGNLNSVLLIIAGLLAGAVITAAIAIVVDRYESSADGGMGQEQVGTSLSDPRVPDLDAARSEEEIILGAPGAVADLPDARVANLDAARSASEARRGETGAVDQLPAVGNSATRTYADILFQEQNLWLPGDTGEADETVLTTERMRFLEENTWLPEAPDSPPSQPRVGVTEY